MKTASRTALLFTTVATTAALAGAGCEPAFPEDSQSDSVVSDPHALTGLAPQLTGVSPSLGPDIGGTSIVLTGRNFRPGASVRFGDATAYDVTVVSSTQIKLTLPASTGTFGRVPVKISLPDGKTASRADLFAYYSDVLSFKLPHMQRARAVSLIVGDFNGDGFNDFAMDTGATKSVDVYLGKGDGSFQSPLSYVLPNEPMGLTLLDVDGDGKRDILVCLPDGNNIAVLPGKGDGTFGAAKVSASIAGVFAAIPVDFNKDGKIDLGVVGSRSRGIGVMLGKGDGTFGASVEYSVGSGGFSTPSPAYCDSADMNGDGKPDLVVQSQAFDTMLSVLLGNGDGTFQPAKVYSSFGFASSPSGLVLGDFNGDRVVDVRTGAAEGGVRVKGRDVRELLGGRGHRHPRRGVERRVGSQAHSRPPWLHGSESAAVLAAG